MRFLDFPGDVLAFARNMALQSFFGGYRVTTSKCDFFYILILGFLTLCLTKMGKKNMSFAEKYNVARKKVQVSISLMSDQIIIAARNSQYK